MIQLDSSALIAFDHLKYPPTHAHLASRRVAYAPAASGSWSLHAVYEFGTVDADGNFTKMDLDIAEIGLDPATMQMAVLTPEQRQQKQSLLYNLLAPGVVPDPADPTQSIAVPSKGGGECKERDVDLIATVLSTALSGTVV